MKFKASRLELIKPLGNLAVSVFEESFKDFCMSHVNTKYPNGSKYDLSLLKYLCNILENSYDKKDKDVASQKLDKKKVVIDCYFAIKNKMGIALADSDREVIGNMIEELHNTKQIKRTSMFKYLYYLFKKRLSK